GKQRPVVDRRYSVPFSMFDARSYPKGAFILHMLRQRLGDEVFWKCLKRYGTEHRLQCVETSDFRKTLEKETGRNLERFFYDWTERPGNPALEITVEYLPDTKQARVAVKQTQAGEAFHFPLKMVFTCPSPEGSRPVVVKQEPEVTEKEHTYFFALPDRPTLFVVDPDQAVLAEIKEIKSKDLWKAQLFDCPSVAARERAVEHYRQSKLPEDRDLLCKAFATEKFYPIQQQIASTLADLGGDLCRDTLLEG